MLAQEIILRMPWRGVRECVGKREGGGGVRGGLYFVFVL